MKHLISILIVLIVAKYSAAQSWVDTTDYPFQSKFLSTPCGKLHYIDEGDGEVILFVHGTPTWSYLYRNYIKALSTRYRCIALDHLGFGLSDKPVDFEGTPEAHAQNLNRIITSLKLKDITLVVHDFGGPIGLSYANKHPENVKRIVLFNTWMWGTKDNAEALKIDWVLHNPIGNFLYLNTNFSPTFLLKNAFSNKRKLQRSTHQHYKRPFPNRKARHGLLKMGKSLVGSSDWYDSMWNQANVIQSIPTLILWGEKDAFIKPTYLSRWEKFFHNREVHRFNSGHFVQEECTEESLSILQSWLAKTAIKS